MKIPRIMIAATGSGSGKTTITCGLLKALQNKGEQPVSFKCGPDYIDPMFHERVLGIPSRNLDPFFSEEKQLRELFLLEQKERKFAVIEGVMGLYDGLGGIREEGSCYHVAKILKTPVILVVDAHGMGRSLVPLLAGFLKYDRADRIKGVILNRMSPMFLQEIAPVIEKELDLPVLGCFPVQKDLNLKSRHLGLVMPGEIEHLQEQIAETAKVLEKYVDIEKIKEIAESAEELEVTQGALEKYLPAKEKKVRIAVAKDEAFCFYYQDNLRMLEHFGAELVPFSPIHDRELPKDIHGILLGGGYPELYAKELSKNRKLKMEIAAAIRSGIPSVAECGGFLYLHETLTDETGKQYPMAGVIAGDCAYVGKLVRFGYICLETQTETFLKKGSRINAHEFHYFDSDDNGNACIAKKPVTGKSWQCVHAGENHFWGFPHLYYPSNPEFAEQFVERACR